MGTIRNSKSETAIIEQLESVIEGLDPTLDLTDGTPLKDVAVDAVASVSRLQYVLLDFVRSISDFNALLAILADTDYLADLHEALPDMTVDEISDYISTTIDGLASLYGKTRIAARAAQYRQRFYRNDDNGGLALTIAVGTKVQLETGTVKAAVQASVAQVPQYDSTRGQWYVEETGVVTVAGTDGNVALNSLNTFVGSIPASFTETTNVSLLLTGTDAESDADLLARCQGAFAGQNINTDDGYEQIMKAEPLGFADAKTVGPGDDLMVRQAAGAIDIYVVGGLPKQSSEQQQYSNLETEYLLSLQPVSSIETVVGSISGSHPATDFQLVADTGAFARSAKARNYMEILNPAAFANGEVLTITATHDSLVLAAQNLLASRTKNVPDADELVKKATQIVVDLELEAISDGTVGEATAQANTLADFGKFLGGGTASTGASYASFELDEDIDKSDLLKALSSVAGWDRIDLDTFKVYVWRNGSRTEVTTDPVPIGKDEYARAGAITFL